MFSLTEKKNSRSIDEKKKIKGKEESKVRYHEISRNENNSYQVYGCVNIQLNIL